MPCFEQVHQLQRGTGRLHRQAECGDAVGQSFEQLAAAHIMEVVGCASRQQAQRRGASDETVGAQGQHPVQPDAAQEIADRRRQQEPRGALQQRSADLERV